MSEAQTKAYILADNRLAEDSSWDRAKLKAEMLRLHEGDLWILGDHRLICGSSTDKGTVNKLLAGEKPHLMITDPPYGVNYDPAWRSQIHNSPSLRTGRVFNDDEDNWLYRACEPVDLLFVRILSGQKCCLYALREDRASLLYGR